MDRRPVVLVVDDDDDIRAAAIGFLEQEGFATLEARDGGEALEVLADLDQGPALILLDMMMPRMDGWTFCKVRQGLKMVRETPVVAMSAARVLDLQEPLRVDALLPKPFDPDELIWLATRMAGRRCIIGPRGGDDG